jgi:hypothetical protein
MKVFNLLMVGIFVITGGSTAHAAMDSYLHCTDTLSWDATDPGASSIYIRESQIGNLPSLGTTVSLDGEIQREIDSRRGLSVGPTLSQLQERGISFTANTTDSSEPFSPGVKITITQADGTQTSTTSVPDPRNHMSQSATKTVVSGSITWTITCVSSEMH